MGATASGCGGVSLPVRTRDGKTGALESTQSQFPQMGGPEIPILRFRTKRRALSMEAIGSRKADSWGLIRIQCDFPATDHPALSQFLPDRLISELNEFRNNGCLKYSLSVDCVSTQVRKYKTS
jgi:hypothetical protein